MPVVLGVDSSTQSTKVELRDVETGAPRGVGRAPHPATTPPRSEQDPNAWWEALETAATAAGVSNHDVACVAIAGQQHGLVVLDAAGTVVRPAKLWNDTESAPDAAWLVEQLGGPQAWADACGSVPVAAFTITKLSWLHRSEPDAWARLERVCLPHDWLTLQLTGSFVTDRGDASGYRLLRRGRRPVPVRSAGDRRPRPRLAAAGPACARPERDRRHHQRVR